MGVGERRIFVRSGQGWLAFRLPPSLGEVNPTDDDRGELLSWF